MGTTVDTGAGKGLLTGEELVRLLTESSTRKAPVAPEQQRRAEEETVTDTPEDEATAATGAGAGDPYAAVDAEGSLGAASDEVIQLAQAPGTAAGVKPAAAESEDGEGAGIPLLLIGGGAAAGLAALGGGGGGGGSGGGAPAGSGGGGGGGGSGGGGGGGGGDTGGGSGGGGDTGGGGGGGGGSGGGGGGGDDDDDDDDGGTPPGPVEDFADFNAQAGGLAPGVETEGSTFIITGGFDRSVLTPPQTLAELSPELVYDLSVDGHDPVDIDFHGLEADFSGDTNVFVAGAAFAGSGESDIIWLANLGAVGHATDKSGDSGAPDAVVGAGAFAKDGGDAEIGISNLYVDITGTGKVIAAGGLVAAASGEGSKAAALVGNEFLVNAEGDSANASAAIVASSGKGHGDDEDGHDGDDDEHEGDDDEHEEHEEHDEDEDDEDEHEEKNEEEHGGGSHAEVCLGDVTVQATALNGHASAELSIDASTGGHERHAASTALVSIEGDVSVKAEGRSAEVSVNVTASGEGEVQIAGELNLSITGSGEGKLAIFAEDSGSSIVVGDIDVAVGEEAHADVYVQFSEDLSGEVSIGDVTGKVDGSLGIHVGELAGDAAADAGRSAAFTGEGNVEMELQDQVFGSIDVSELDGEFDLEMDLQDTNPDTFPHTTILGYDAATDSVEINGDELSDENVAVLGAFTDEGKMFDELEDALHGHDDYAFAVYTGEDITGDGVDEQGLGVLVYDDNGKGITTVLFLQDVDTVQELVGTQPA